MSNLIKLKQIQGGIALNNTVNANADAIADLETLVGTTSVASQIDAAKPEVHTITSDSTDISVLTEGITAKAGDILIVTSTTNNVKSAYHYDAVDGWIACDGNVDATKVILKDNITLAGNYTVVGNITKTSNAATGTFETAGKSVAAALTEIFSKRLQPSNKPGQPAVTLTFSQAGDYEVGTTVSPSYSVSLSKGSYTYGPSATGVVASKWNITDTDSHSAEYTTATASGTFADFVVDDGDEYKITAVATHNEGAVALDNLGSASNPEIKIAAGTKSATSGAVKGYRKWFMYIGTDHTSTIDSAFIRKATNMGKGSDASTQTEVTIPGGTTRIMIAIPKAVTGAKFTYGKTLGDVIDVDGMGLPVTGNFNNSTVQVEGANGHTAVDYNVWVCENANGISATRYTFNIG